MFDSTLSGWVIWAMAQPVLSLPWATKICRNLLTNGMSFRRKAVIFLKSVFEIFVTKSNPLEYLEKNKAEKSFILAHNLLHP
jgi:hypothetical protein